MFSCICISENILKNHAPHRHLILLPRPHKKSVYHIGLLFALASQTYTLPLIEASTVFIIIIIYLQSHDMSLTFGQKIKAEVKILKAHTKLL